MDRWKIAADWFTFTGPLDKLSRPARQPEIPQIPIRHFIHRFLCLYSIAASYRGGRPNYSYFSCIFHSSRPTFSRFTAGIGQSGFLHFCAVWENGPVGWAWFRRTEIIRDVARKCRRGKYFTREVSPEKNNFPPHTAAFTRCGISLSKSASKMTPFNFDPRKLRGWWKKNIITQILLVEYFVWILKYKIVMNVLSALRIKRLGNFGYAGD